MTPSQHELLRALLDTYVGRLPETSPSARWPRSPVRRFPRSTSRGRAARSRVGRTTTVIQGHRLLVEYDNTTRDANHVHTVWRDPVGDFGMDLLGAHRRRGH